MTPDGSIELIRNAVQLALVVAAPLLIVSLITGVLVSLFQALTQIQEATLSFVPKILVMFVSLLLLLPFMIASLSTFTERLADRIASLG